LTVVALVQDLTAAAFVALGLAIAYRWFRDRGRAQGRLAVALLALGGVAAGGRMPQSTALSLLEIAAFMLCAYFVLLFRDEFLPLSRRAHWAAGAVLVAGIVDGILVVTVFSNSPVRVVTVLALLFIAAWGMLIGEPVFRFWVASNALPAVQKTRMRFLSFGFGMLIAILFVEVIGGSALRSPAALVIAQLLALATVPLIYVSFAPPSLLRRIWRMSEENAVRAAMQDLLIFTPTRKDLAERAVFWAVRLLGGTSGYILDSQRKLIAGEEPNAANPVVTAPLHMPEGEGTLAVVAGPFTPMFGTDEVAQLRGYANSVSAGLQRVSVTERVAAIENSKTQFLNLASHEMRGPVTVIRGYVSMLEDGMLGELNERGRKAAEVMAAKVSEMNELIEEMIEAARIEDGGVTLRLVEVDLRDIARKAADSVAPMVDGRHRLEVDLPERRVRVRVDPDRTRTILANLLSNAIKYSPRGGRIRVCTLLNGGCAEVCVIDHGNGIPPEFISRLFGRYERYEDKHAGKIIGTGLGLAITRQIVEMHGGRITVDSVVGKGSEFRFTVPLAATAAAVTRSA
jgi:signal transduction histidine kinase